MVPKRSLGLQVVPEDEIEKPCGQTDAGRQPVSNQGEG